MGKKWFCNFVARGKTEADIQQLISDGASRLGDDYDSGKSKTRSFTRKTRIQKRHQYCKQKRNHHMNEDSKAKIRMQLINLTQNKKTVKKVKRIAKILCKPVMLDCICIIERSSIGKIKKKTNIRERCPKFTATCKENVKEMLNEIVKVGGIHNKRWKKTSSRQRRLFEEGGCQLTQAWLKNIEPLRQPYLGPVVQTLGQGGCWLGKLADDVIKALMLRVASAIDAAGRPAPGPPGIGGSPPGILPRPPPGTGARPPPASIPRPSPGIGGRPPPGPPPPSSPPTPPSQTPPSQTPPVPPTPPGLQVGDDSIQNVTTLKPTVANNASPDRKNTTPNIGATKSPQQGNTSDVVNALGRTSRVGQKVWAKNKKTLKNSCKCRNQMQRSKRTRGSRKDRKKKMKIYKIGSKRLGQRNMKQNAKVTRKLQKKTSMRSGPTRKRRQEKFLHGLKQQIRHAKPRQNKFKNGKQGHKGKNKRRFKSQTNARRTKCWSLKRKIGNQSSGGWPCSKGFKKRKERSKKKRRQTSFKLLRKTRKFGLENRQKIYHSRLKIKFGSRKELCKRVCGTNYKNRQSRQRQKKCNG